MNWLRRRVTLEDEGLASTLLNSSFLRRRNSRDSVASVEDGENDGHHGERHFLPVLPQALRRKSKCIKKSDSTLSVPQDTPKSAKDKDMTTTLSNNSKASSGKTSTPRQRQDSMDSVVTVDESKEKFERRIETLQKQLDDMRAAHLREVCRLKQEARLKEIEPEREFDSVDLFSTSNTARPQTGNRSNAPEKDPKKLLKMYEDKRDEVDNLTDQYEKQRERLLAYKALAAQRTMLFERSMELVLEVLRRQGYDSIASYLAAVPNEQREKKSVGDVVTAVEQEVDTNIKKAKAAEMAQKLAEEDRSRFWSVEAEEQAEAIAATNETARRSNARMSQFAVDLDMPSVTDLEAAISKVNKGRDFMTGGPAPKARKPKRKKVTTTSPPPGDDEASSSGSELQDVKKHPFLDVSSLLCEASRQTVATQTEPEEADTSAEKKREQEFRKRQVERSNTIDRALGGGSTILGDAVSVMGRKHPQPSKRAPTDITESTGNTGRTVNILKLLCQPVARPVGGRDSKPRWRRSNSVVPVISREDDASSVQIARHTLLPRRKSLPTSCISLASTLDGDSLPSRTSCSKCSAVVTPLKEVKRLSLVDAAVDASVGSPCRVDRAISPIQELNFSLEGPRADTSTKVVDGGEDEEIDEDISAQISYGREESLKSPVQPESMKSADTSPKSARIVKFRSSTSTEPKEPKRSSGGEQDRKSVASLGSDGPATNLSTIPKRRPEQPPPNVSSSQCMLPEVDEKNKLVYIRDEPAFQRKKIRKRTALF